MTSALASAPLIQVVSIGRLKIQLAVALLVQHCTTLRGRPRIPFLFLRCLCILGNGFIDPSPRVPLPLAASV